MPLLVEFIRISALSSKSPGVPPRQMRNVFGPTTLSGVLSPTMVPFSARQNLGSPFQSWNLGIGAPPPPPRPPRPRWSGGRAACASAAAFRAACACCSPGSRAVPLNMLSNPVRSSKGRTAMPRPPPPPRPPWPRPSPRPCGGCPAGGCCCAVGAAPTARTIATAPENRIVFIIRNPSHAGRGSLDPRQVSQLTSIVVRCAQTRI